MNAAGLLAALDLPAAARVDRRVPKTMLHEHGAPTAADKRRISDGIEQLQWVAALKPTTAGIAAYRDELREYLEVLVLHISFRSVATVNRIVELIHRAVPYPLLLIAEQDGGLHLSLAHKRWSQGQAGKVVLDGELISVAWDGAVDDAHGAAFCAALALDRQPRLSLHAVYEGWMNTVGALQAARRTGIFAKLDSPASAALRREALQECARLDAEIARLRATAAKEKQLSRRVELNLELKRVEAAYTTARANL